MIDACSGSSISTLGGGTKRTICSKTSFIPVPFLALIAGASEASTPIISSISFFILSGSDWSKSILFKTGIIVSPSYTAL